MPSTKTQDYTLPLREAIVAFETGKGALSSPSAQLLLESTYLDELCRQLAFSAKDQDAFLALARGRSKGIQAARERQLSVAQNVFLENRQRLRELQVSAHCESVCTAFQIAAEAYVCYALDRFDEARELVYEAMRIDAELEQERGYSLLHLHRIQLLHNLVRVDERRGCSEEALLLCWQTLSYLQGHKQPLPGPAPWDVRTISRIPCQLVSGMFNQVVAEMATILAGGDIDRAEFVEAAANYLHVTASTRSCGFRPALTWLDLKGSFFTSRLQFVKECCDFLRAERSSHPTLWFATAFDLAVACKEMNPTQFDILALDLSFEPLPAKIQSALIRLTNNNSAL